MRRPRELLTVCLLFVPLVAWGQTVTLNLGQALYTLPPTTNDDGTTTTHAPGEPGVLNVGQLGASLNDAYFQVQGTITGVGVTPLIFRGLWHHPTLIYDTALVLSSPSFEANMTLEPNTALTESAAEMVGFLNDQQFTPNLTSGTETLNELTGFRANMAASLLNAGAATITNWSNYAGAQTLTNVGSGVTVTNWRDYQVNDPLNSGTITNQYGVDIPNLTRGGTEIAGIRSAVASGTGKYNIKETGTAVNVFAGNSRFGGTTNPTVAVDVTGALTTTGNVIVGGTETVNNVLSALASVSVTNFAGSGLGGSILLYEDTNNGTNFEGFEAPVAVTANTTLVLPDGPGVTGQVMVTDGAAGTPALAWKPLAQVLTTTSDTSIASVTEVQVLSGSITGVSGRHMSIAGDMKFINSSSGSRSYTATIKRGGTVCSDATAVTDGDEYFSSIAAADRQSRSFLANEASQAGAVTYRLCVLSSSATGTQTFEFGQLTFTEY